MLGTRRGAAGPPSATQAGRVQRGHGLQPGGSGRRRGGGAFLLELLTALSGPFALLLVAYVAFLVVYAVLVSLDDEAPVVRDAVMTVLMATVRCHRLRGLRHRGLLHPGQGLGRPAPPQLLHPGHVQGRAVGPADPGRDGPRPGRHRVDGRASPWCSPCPSAWSAAVYLDMTRGRPSRFFRTVVEAMTALPSILAGLFIYAAWILDFGFGRSGLAAALALSVMMLPYIIRASDLALRLVPANLREASAALGAPAWRGEWQVVIPTARSGPGHRRHPGYRPGHR